MAAHDKPSRRHVRTKRSDTPAASTLFPAISFGSAAVTLYTSNTSLLGNLIGGNTASNFSFLSVRGVYPTATMTVSFKGSEGR